ncbi:MAG: methyltransferase domain-containing protein [Tatlockia sp.]|nr:methyltransferase domain-containing protein [Tatlockia sp.]
MDASEFCQVIKVAFDYLHKTTFLPIIFQKNQFFLNELAKLPRDNSLDESLKMTRASVLFEGYYRHLDINTDLKQALNNIKVERWKQHFGTPTVTFLLSFKSEIDLTTELFDNYTNLVKIAQKLPWHVNKENGFELDKDNNLVSDPITISRVRVPEHKEVTGIFTKTHNPFGGFTTTPCDPISQQFITHAAIASKNGGKVLEIGAAFGAATLEAIVKGATIFCNDVDPSNLAVVRKRFLEMSDDQSESVTGDCSKLVLVPGALPEELIGLPTKFFDAILICRVLHFFTGIQIEKSLSLLSQLLAPGGKVYIVCETPWLKNWQRFLPELNRRIENGVEWPGEITNPAEYESSGRITSLPKFVHWITKEVLERSLSRAGFKIEHSTYINRKGQFPEDLLLPEYERESVGAVGIRL